MSTLTRLLATAAVATAIAGPAAAQEAPGVPQRKPPAPAAARTDAFLEQQKERQSISSDIVGMNVTTQTGEKAGKIDGLLLDDQGNVIGAIMSVGGFLGLGAKKIALRWENVRIQSGNEPKAVIDMSEEQLMDAPEFKTLADIRKEREDQSRRRAQRPGTGTSGGAPGSGGMPTTR